MAEGDVQVDVETPDGDSLAEDAEVREDEYHGPDPEENDSGTADDEDQGI